MPTATYREFRVVLQVRLSHQMGRDIPTHLFHLMLRQARLSRAEFFALLQSRGG